jgi:O-antigen/teichoic acid export membrane protein
MPDNNERWSTELFGSILAKFGFLSSHRLRRLVSMLAGQAISRLVTLLTLPALTRIYSADTYQSWPILVSLAAFFMPFATFRLEMAIVLEPKLNRAMSLSAFLLAVTTGYSIILAYMFANIMPESVSRYIGLKSAGVSPLLLSILLMLSVLQTLLLQWVNRVGLMGKIGLIQLTQASGFAFFGILLPIVFEPSSIVLIVSGILALAMSILHGLIVLRSKMPDLVHNVDGNVRNQIHAVTSTISKFRVYVFSTLPFSLSVVITERVLQYVVINAGESGGLANFLLARQLTLAPFQFLIAPLQQTLLTLVNEEPDFAARKAAVSRILRKAATWISFVSLPSVCFCHQWLPLILRTVLGEGWSPTGSAAAYLIFPAYVAAIGAWMDRVFDVLGRQVFGLKLQVSADLLLILALLICHWLSLGFDATVLVISTVLSISSALWVVAIFTKVETGSLSFILRWFMVAISLAISLVTMFSWISNSLPTQSAFWITLTITVVSTLTIASSLRMSTISRFWRF